SSCSTPSPDESAPSSSRRLPARVWAATSAPIPISENAAPNCARCSGASYDLVTGNAAPPVGPNAAADMAATLARGPVEPQCRSHRLGRGLLRGLGILRPPHGPDFHGAAQRDLSSCAQ